MSSNWASTTLSDASLALDTLIDLCGKGWLSRGHSQTFKKLVPTIDRDTLRSLSRPKKLALERQSIDIFRSTARFFADRGEEGALTDDIVALMVLRHYGVPTRLLDWSKSPYVAAYFAAACSDDKNGEIWSFDYWQYVKEGTKQWEKWPETTKDRSGRGEDFIVGLTAFMVDEPPDWIVCGFYENKGFPRQDAQSSICTFTARFGRDHADVIAALLIDGSYFHRYIVPKALKPELRRLLREKHGIWQGSLFPDSAGAAETARMVFRS